MQDQCTEYRNPGQSKEKKNQTNSRKELYGIATLAVPYLIFLVALQEEPAKLHSQWAAVGDGNVADHLGIIQDTAEVQVHGLKGQVGVMHFPTQAQAVDLRVLQVPDG